MAEAQHARGAQARGDSIAVGYASGRDDRRVRQSGAPLCSVGKRPQRERGPALEPSEGAWLAILRNSSSSVILSIEVSTDWSSWPRIGILVSVESMGTAS